MRRQYQRWSTVELAKLRALAAAGLTAAEIASQLPGRSAATIYPKLRTQPRAPREVQVRAPAATSLLDQFLRKPWTRSAGKGRS